MSLRTSIAHILIVKEDILPIILFRTYATIYGGSIGIAMALVARLARTLRFEQPEHLPLEFGSFVAASGFLSGALIAFLTTWIAKGSLESTFSKIRFILVIFGFGISTGFVRGILNPISVSSFDLYKGFLTTKEFFDLVANHLFRFYLNGMVEAVFTVITALILLVTLTGLSCASHDEKQPVEETKLVITDPTPNSLDLKDQNITNIDQSESSYTFDLQNFNNIPVNFIDSSSKSQDTIADTNRPILFADMHETKTEKSPVTKIQMVHKKLLQLKIPELSGNLMVIGSPLSQTMAWRRK